MSLAVPSVQLNITNLSFGYRYSIVSSSPEERKMFRVLRMQYVVLDEAHMLKNMATQRYDNLARINVSKSVTISLK
jgi:SWI/SNF-related matrix-associated actin-dependent regulator 1 of chromatin subfamily A